VKAIVSGAYLCICIVLVKFEHWKIWFISYLNRFTFASPKREIIEFVSLYPIHCALLMLNLIFSLVV
jgi:hypothetical protein